MAFFTYSEQARIRLSKYAEDIITFDISVWGSKSRTSFINTIILNYYESANASIGRRLDEYRNGLLELNDLNANSFIDKLVNQKQIELENLTKSYSQEELMPSTSPTRLQVAVMDLLFNEDSDMSEDLYYTSVPKYLAAIIEEYSRLPYVKRERIYYKDKFDAIEEAILLEKQIRISTKNLSFYVVPYAIMTDPLSTANYLVGFSYKGNEDKNNKTICSFRMSAIQKVKRENSKSGKIHNKDAIAMTQAIQAKGVMYLLADTTDEIVVKFSNHGIRLYERLLHMRPNVFEVDGNIYKFNCSIEQAKTYFFKYGKDAEILAPLSLREYFSNGYIDAYNNYK